MTAKRVELPDNRKLLAQLGALERRSRSGGRDLVDHPPGSHDDLANAVAGACVEAAQPAPSAVIQARNLAPSPVRQGLNLVGGNDTTNDDAARSDYSRDPWTGWDDDF